MGRARNLENWKNEPFAYPVRPLSAHPAKPTKSHCSTRATGFRGRRVRGGRLRWRTCTAVGRALRCAVMPRELIFGNRRILRLGGHLVSAHLLVDETELTLIDTGLWGVPAELRRVIKSLGRSPEALRNIVLTHGHLDHAGGAAEIQAWSGARVWLHPADQEHVNQRVRYTGGARGCGWLERAGSLAGRLGGWRYHPPVIGGELRDGNVLPFWGGLRVWHLPGHCVVVAECAHVVFSGDLFASYGWSVHRPPSFPTRDRTAAEASLQTLAATQPTAVLPSHYDRMAPDLHARRLQSLVGNPVRLPK